MRFRILGKTALFLICEGKVAAILGLVGQKIHGNPCRIANKVDQMRHFRLHSRDALNPRRAVANYRDTLVGPVIVLVPSRQGWSISQAGLHGTVQPAYHFEVWTSLPLKSEIPSISGHFPLLKGGCMLV